MSPTHASGEYRRDIDGMRAVAVLLVLVFHAYPKLLPSGFIGVDVFFVISGFLITSIVRRELAASQFSWLVFYARRCRRILPALLLLLLAIWAYGRAYLDPDQFSNLGKHLWAASIFISNHVLFGEAGYFDEAAIEKPLLHLWSLAVEEQFYLIWPALLVLGHRLSHGGSSARGTRWIVGIVGVSSLVLTFVFRARPNLVFYFLASRAWELALGAALSLLREPATSDARAIRANACSIAGLGLLLWGVLVTGGQATYPMAWALLLATCGAALIIRAGPDAVLNRVLSNRALVYIGLLSYPLYLWHWPLLALLHSSVREYTTPAMINMMLLASVVLSISTRELIEKPVQSHVRFDIARSTTARATVALGMVGLSITAALGWATWHGHMFTARQTLANQLAPSEKAAWPVYKNGDCFLGDPAQTFEDFGSDCLPPAARHGPNVLVWGDSFSTPFFPALDEAVGAAQGSLTTFAATQCPPVLGIDNALRPNCSAINDFVFARIAERRFSTVLLAANWSLSYFQSVNDPTFARIDDTLARLKRAGVGQIVIIGQPARWKTQLRNLLMQNFSMHGVAFPRETNAWLDPQTWPVEAALTRHAWGEGVRYFSLLDIACPGEHCGVFVPGPRPRMLWTFDEGHPTLAAAKYYVARLRPWLVENQSALR